MREFAKQVIVALKEDDWTIRANSIRHNKSFLIINTRKLQPEDVPFEFTWWERRVVGHYVKKLRDRMLVAKLIEYRLNPRKEERFSHENTFLY
jgi:hypothetical protein